jgi:hypothetical protein
MNPHSMAVGVVWWRWADSNRRPEPGAPLKVTEFHVALKALIATRPYPTPSKPGHPRMDMLGTALRYIRAAVESCLGSVAQRGP